ncbi:MAG: FG-GAP repeat protein [Oscillospiraceae bacterium]|nr:FG-GAP repeat protein [Oscillospiraceae bacterium]
MTNLPNRKPRAFLGVTAAFLLLAGCTPSPTPSVPALAAAATPTAYPFGSRAEVPGYDEHKRQLEEALRSGKVSHERYLPDTPLQIYTASAAECDMAGTDDARFVVFYLGQYREQRYEEDPFFMAALVSGEELIACAPEQTLESHSTIFAHELAVADFDGDGTDEILVYSPVGGSGNSHFITAYDYTDGSLNAHNISGYSTGEEDVNIHSLKAVTDKEKGWYTVSSSVTGHIGRFQFDQLDMESFDGEWTENEPLNADTFAGFSIEDTDGDGASEIRMLSFLWFSPFSHASNVGFGIETLKFDVAAQKFVITDAEYMTGDVFYDTFPQDKWEMY